MKKVLFWLFAGICSFVVSLVVLAPLPLVVQQIAKMRPELQFAGVSGSLWQGTVQRLTTPQAVINDLNWTIAPKKLLSGYLAADLQAEVKTVQLRGECGIAPFSQNLHCSPLRAELDAANLHQLTPPGRRIPVKLAGNLIANLDDITWDRQNIPVANGRVLWDEGKVENPIKLDLGGRYRANIEGDKDGNALSVELESQDTMVVLDGGVSVEPEGRFEYEVFVKPAGKADPSIGAALELIGAPQNDGSIRFKDKGELLSSQTE
ncbi:MAG: type II secretion system protein N [Thiolinea sp.]